MFRRAWTIIELLVSLAIIAVLTSLLLMAAQRVRESARSIQCTNQVRQLALATQHFVSSHQHFPGNGWGFRWLGQPERGVGLSQPGGWAFQLLPFLEASLPPESTYPTPVVARGEWTQIIFPVFDCPSRPTPGKTLHSARFSPFNAEARHSVAKSDYAICEGDYVTHTLAGPRSLAEGDSASYRWIADDNKATGISYQRSRITPGQVRDGLSNTYAIGEKQVNRQHYLDGKDLGYDQSLLSGVDLDLNRWVIDPPIGDWDRGGNGRQFGSAHHAGWHMALCDGSVTRYTYDLDPSIHVRLGNRHDGEALAVGK